MSSGGSIHRSSFIVHRFLSHAPRAKEDHITRFDFDGREIVAEEDAAEIVFEERAERMRAGWKAEVGGIDAVGKSLP